MAFCIKCGKEVKEDVEFCGSCGAPTGVAAGAPAVNNSAGGDAAGIPGTGISYRENLYSAGSKHTLPSGKTVTVPNDVTDILSYKPSSNMAKNAFIIFSVFWAILGVIAMIYFIKFGLDTFYSPWMGLSAIIPLFGIIIFSFPMITLWQLKREKKLTELKMIAEEEQRKRNKSVDDNVMELAKKDEQKKGYIGCSLVVGVILLFVIGIGICNNDSSNTTDTTAEHVTIAQQVVKERLKSPSTAKFPASFKEYNITKGGNNRVTVSGYVDAQNAFGAVLRNRFTVVIEFPDGNYTGRYRIISVDIL